MIKPTSQKKIHQNMESNQLVAYRFDNPISQGVLRVRSKKNQQFSSNRIHNEDIFKQRIDKISYQLKEQKKIFQENIGRLLKKIEEYYIQISQKLESQRSEVQKSLKQQFRKIIDIFSQHQDKIKEARNQYNQKKKKHKTHEFELEKIASIQIPIIVFHEAKFESLDCIVTAFHPLMQISVPGTNRNRKNKKIEENTNLKPPFSYSRTAKHENNKQNHEKVLAHLNAFKKSAPLLDSEQQCKTVVKGKGEDFLLCEEEVSEWKYESFKAKKGVSVEEIIAEESESKQSSLLSQQLS